MSWNAAIQVRRGSGETPGTASAQVLAQSAVFGGYAASGGS